MDWNQLPWDKGIGTLFGVILLKMVFDLVYKKIPRGFRQLRQSNAVQSKQLENKIVENTEAIDLLREEVVNLEDMQLDRDTAREAGRPRHARRRRSKRRANEPPASGDV